MIQAGGLMFSKDEVWKNTLQEALISLLGVVRGAAKNSGDHIKRHDSISDDCLMSSTWLEVDGAFLISNTSNIPYNNNFYMAPDLSWAWAIYCSISHIFPPSSLLAIDPKHFENTESSLFFCCAVCGAAAVGAPHRPQSR